MLARGLRFLSGYLHWNPECRIMMLESTELNMWETGSYEERNIGIGSMAFPAENSIIRLWFAAEIRESARPTSGKNAHLHEEKMLLRTCDASSLTMDRMCDWAGEKKCCSCLILHRLRCGAGAISNENTKFSPETDCQWT